MHTGEKVGRLGLGGGQGGSFTGAMALAGLQGVTTARQSSVLLDKLIHLNHSLRTEDNRCCKTAPAVNLPLLMLIHMLTCQSSVHAHAH